MSRLAIKSRRTAIRATLVVAALAALSLGAYALAAATVPAPSITAAPANPTSSTSASFSFTGAPAGGSYQCKLDAAAFAACTSPKAYTGLASGSHTFQVMALDKSKKQSSPTSYTWTIDATPPTVSSIARASASPTNASAVQWTIIFSEPVSGVDATDFALVKSGVTGASSAVTVTGGGAAYTATLASTGSGDGSVGLNLVDNDSIKDALANTLGGTGAGNGSFTGQVYVIDRTPPANAPTIASGPSGLVNSSSATFSFSSSESGVAGFRCQIDAGPVQPCSSPASFSGLPDGSRTFMVRAADAAGNVSLASATRTWTIDTTPPPPPVLGSKPDDPNGDGIANFDWTDAESPVTYKCSLENGSFSSCASPFRAIVDVSNDGQHQFAVRAYDAAGNFRETDYSWKVLHAINVVADGNAVGALYPGGPTRTIALTLHNPNNFPVTISLITASISASPPGCSAATNVVLEQSNVGNGADPKTVTVPANSNLTLPSGAATSPTIRMLNLPSNQDACKNGAFTLSYVAKGNK